MGKVQGVFYRKYSCEKAKDLGLSGWVKNHSDGTVEIQLEGMPLAIGQMIDWCKKGPKNAVVTEVEIEYVELEDHSDFRIVR